MKYRTHITIILLLAAVLAASRRAVAVEDPEALQKAFSAAIRKVSPSIVSIKVTWKPGKRLLGSPIRGRRRYRRSNGPVTGVVLSSRGYIITSDFNVNSDARKVSVTLSGGETFAARILGRDVSRGLQLLAIDSRELKKRKVELAVPSFSLPEDVKVGNWALACGFDPDATLPSLSVGIVSATGRIMGRAIQFDASANPTNYGGPLIDVQGRVVGIITPLVTTGSDKSIRFADSGIAFAVPIPDILKNLRKLRSGQTIRPAFLGIGFDHRVFRGGALVTSVQEGTGAAEAGIKPKDVIVEFNGVSINTVFTLLHQIGSSNVGDVVKFKVLRDGEEIELTATLGPRPEKPPARR